MEYKLISDITYHPERASVVFIVQDEDREVILCSISKKSIKDFTGASRSTDKQIINFVRLRVKNILNNIPSDPTTFKTEINRTTTFKAFSIESINCKKFFENEDERIMRHNNSN